jgi:uncharacterized protein YceH (UPF0502 family)
MGLLDFTTMEEPMPETAMPPNASPPSWPVLSLNERRVLGVLVEKAKTTPDAYPLSMNSVVTGSNQKSNRDPVLDLTEDDAEEALVSSQKKGLAVRITGGRVERWRHSLYEAWAAGKVELAILAELLLRGPQTEGELRSRASRMEPIDDLDALRALLKPLVERGLVVYLGPEGRRGTMLTHGFHDPEELKHLRGRHGSSDADTPSCPAAPAASGHASGSTPPIASLEARLTEAQKEIAELRKAVADLQGQVGSLTVEVKSLKGALGV